MPVEKRDRGGGCRGRGKGAQNSNLYMVAVSSLLLVIIMGKLKERIIRLIEQEAAKKVSDLSGKYVRARPGQKEVILAGMDIEKWLIECCQECAD